MKAGLVAIVVIHAASVFVAAFHQRATFRQSRTHTTQLALKKIADEESSVWTCLGGRQRMDRVEEKFDGSNGPHAGFCTSSRIR